MKIKEYLGGMGNDFSATMVCEHCSTESKLTSGYHDGRYHNLVIPAMHCKACGLNRAGQERTDEVVAAAKAIGIGVQMQ